MTPGITHEAEVWEVIESKELSNSCEAWNHTYDPGSRSITCSWNNESLTIGLDSQQDQLRSIGFQPSTAIHINDIIKKHGTPTWVAIWEGDSPEHIAVQLAIFYDEITTRLDFLQQDGERYNLRPEAEIVGVSYLSTQEYRKFIKSMEWALVPWNGYGEYQKK